MNKSDSVVVPSLDNKIELTSWATNQMHPNMSLCININYSQCEMLPYNQTTLRSVLSIVRSIEMEKFLKFFGYLNRLGCYQHIMLFGCNLALPQCINDGVN
ncbi:Atrial natriuretic peptide-converting enzyme, partial [Ophiophagus hannah]